MDSQFSSTTTATSDHQTELFSQSATNETHSRSKPNHRGVGHKKLNQMHSMGLTNVKTPKDPVPRADTPGGRIHADCAGPMPVGSNGDRYFFVFVDSCTGMIFLSTAKHKSQSLEALQQPTQLRINELRTDNGGEWCSKAFTQYCQDTGIRQTFTVPHTPEQNGLAPSTWPEAARHATFLHNRIPKESNPNKQPPFEQPGSGTQHQQTSWQTGQDVEDS